MVLGDMYKSKKGNDIIVIDSFATPLIRGMDAEKDTMYIICKHMINDGGMVASCPSFNSYSTQAEIEDNYDLYYTSEQIYDLFQTGELDEFDFADFLFGKMGK